MPHHPFQDALVLTGPTGSGKSALALPLAERLGAEIVCMDSMTLYRGMNIGTAKPSAADRARVPHHLLDVLNPWESASVAWWLERAGAYYRDIQARGRRALFVGGTPLYLKALLHGLFKGPSADPIIRDRLSEEADRLGAQSLHDRLAAVDPISAKRLHPNDIRRVVRALEVWELTGRPLSEQQVQWPGWPASGEQAPRAIWPAGQCVYLDLPRQELYRRINNRVERMIAEGFLEEVRSLASLAKPLSRETSQALGYQEFYNHLAGQCTMEEAGREVQMRTRNFAKRQLTWFRRLPECQAISGDQLLGLWGPQIDRA
jgi:tRNA dimethylallyltransferase